MRINKFRFVIKEEDGAYNVDGRRQYNKPELVADFLNEQLALGRLAEEHLYCICLDTKNHIIGFFEASQGMVNYTLFPIREIFSKALVIGAVRIILAHNHPSGDPEPSTEDLVATKRAVSAGEVLGLEVIDSIIVGSHGYCSLMKEGKLK